MVAITVQVSGLDDSHYFPGLRVYPRFNSHHKKGSCEIGLYKRFQGKFIKIQVLVIDSRLQR